jgi:hypothetical protein
LKVITQGEALEALNQVSRDDHESFSIVGEPDHLVGPVSVFFVRIWDGEEVNWEYVMFYRKDGKVKVYEGRN